MWKRCIKDNVASNEFVYPKNGIVKAKDWDNKVECGGGLHGWTEGFEEYFDKDLKGNMVVMLVNKDDGFITLRDKVKFKKGKVLLNTLNIEEAHRLIKDYYPNVKLHWATQKAGGSSTQTAGHSSTQTTEGSSTQTAGNGSFINNYVFKYSYNIVRPSRYSVVSSINVYKGKAKSFVSTRDDITYVINGDCKVVKEYTSTDEKIEKLEEFEIFVFGSNLNGNHAGGAAKYAKDRFEAKEGVGEGLTGKCYAFPTLDKSMNKVSDVELKESVKKLIETANENTGKVFLLTRVGCGIAGFDEEHMKTFFKDIPANIIKPKGW